MRIQLRGDQPTTGDFVMVNGEFWKIVTSVTGGEFVNSHRAVNRAGDSKIIALYHNQGYTCRTSRACAECTYLDSHAEGCSQ